MMLILSLILGLLLVALVLAITLGGPVRHAPMACINDPFGFVEIADLPPLMQFHAADGQPLAYRVYPPLGERQGSVTLIHGSSASSTSMHPLAESLAAAGYQVYALDIRGHGQSGHKGHIGYVGQLESDLATFARTVRPPEPSTLAGFSAGGGFVLRFAGTEHRSLFGSYLLLAPFISQDAPNQRLLSGEWASVGAPRIVALSVLNAIGVRWLNSLSVISFALSEEARALLTPEYDFNLATNFRPPPDYLATIRAATRPCVILAGTHDEAFYSDRLEEIVRSGGQDWTVELVPNVGHVQLILEPAAIAAIVRCVRQVQQAA